MGGFRPVDDDWNKPEAADAASFCRQCGKSLVEFPGAYVRYYCSRACRNAAHREWRRQKSGPPCPVCGKPVEWLPGRQAKFCSIACFGESIRKHPRRSVTRTCPVCQAAFTVRSGTEKKRCCSVQCAGTFKRKYPLPRGLMRAAARAGRSCVECGKPMTPSRSDARYCSRRCQQGAWQKRKRAEKQARGFKCEAVD